MSHISESSEELELFHFGVKGMKWGVRRTDAQISAAKTPSARRQRYDDIRNAPPRTVEVTAKNGKTVRAIEEPTGKVSAFLSSLSKTGVEDASNAPSFKIEADGKHVGEAAFNKRSSDEINLVWLGVKETERGNGYASAIFDAAVQFGKSEGVSRLTLEVPGNAPDARHIYEKQGFKVTKEPTKREIRTDPVWGGLTHMELDISKAGIKHSEISEDDELELALSQTFPQLTPEQESLVFGSDNSMEHSEDLELFHYGVKGMKWGVSKKSSSSRKGIRQKIKDRDDSIQKSRDQQAGAIIREASAVNKSVRAKGNRIRNLRDPEAKAASKSATTSRKEATANRKEVNRSANRMTSKELATKGATVAIPIILSVGYLTAGTVGTRRNAKVGKKIKTDIFADTKGLPRPGTIALTLVDGVWQ